MGGIFSRFARKPTRTTLATWNIAAVNNNPFEYYTKVEGDARYDALMLGVQEFMDAPDDRDVAVSVVFTPAMFEKLAASMKAEGIDGVDEVAKMWESDYSQRKIVSGFIKDKEIGAKRLASMPDRFTNTINCADGRVVCRPTVINNYLEAMPDGDAWFNQWSAFFFETSLPVAGKGGAVAEKKPCAMLGKIKKDKYPAISAEEEAVSIPLQLLCCAIFDAVLVHTLNTLAPGAWHELKNKITQSLVVGKAARTLALLQRREYADTDVFFLQEASVAFASSLKETRAIADKYAIFVPAAADAVRDQNSVILVAKAKLAAPDAPLAEVLAPDGAFGSAAVDDGDLAMCRASLKLGAADGAPTEVLLASFHGDTNGLASTPVVSAVRALAAAEGLPVLFGLDANTHAALDPKGARKHVDEFVGELAAGDAPPLAHSWTGAPADWTTTYCARTFLQPQLNKAVRAADAQTSPLTDRNPKDFLLFSPSAFDVTEPCVRDCTGAKTFDASSYLPTLTFPSDHAIVSAALEFKVPAAAPAAE